MAAKGKTRGGEPIHPGTAIASDVLGKYDLTQDELAKLTGVSRRTINQLVNFRRNLTADMALRIAKVTGTSARDWLVAQMEYDLVQAARTSERRLAKIAKLPAPKAKPAPKAAPAKAPAKPARPAAKKAAKPAARKAKPAKKAAKRR